MDKHSWELYKDFRLNKQTKFVLILYVRCYFNEPVCNNQLAGSSEYPTFFEEIDTMLLFLKLVK